MIGSAAQIQGKEIDAAPRFARAMEAFDAAGNVRGRTMAAHGYLSTGTFTPEEQERLFDRTLQDARALGNKTIEGQLLHHRGDGRFMTGDYVPALKDLEDAAALLEQAGAASHLGTVYNSIGRLYACTGKSRPPWRIS